MRMSTAMQEDAHLAKKGGSKGSSGSLSPGMGMNRSKTVMGRKLRVMTVEKGLLRETKAVQRMIDALVECRVRCWLSFLSKCEIRC
jgi:hypothetical protein